MKKLTLSALALLVMTASALTLRGGNMQTAAASELANSAAYRDGLYLGKLAAEQGSDSHVSTGRWIQAKDRVAFAAGYEGAYNQLITERLAPGGQR
jgi:hypothetical protein